MIAEGTSDELEDRVGGERLGGPPRGPSDADRAIAAPGEMTDERPVLEDGAVRVLVRQPSGSIAEAVRRLDGVGIDDIALRRPALDDVFSA